MTTPNKLPPIFDPERIEFVKKIESKKCAFDTLTNLLVSGQKEVSKHDVFDALINREKLGNTSIGNGIAVPKAHLPITNPRAAILIIKKGLDLDTVDKQVVTFFLAVIVPEKLREQYSVILSELNKKLILNGIPETALKSKSPQLISKYFETLFNEIHNEAMGT